MTDAQKIVIAMKGTTECGEFAFMLLKRGWETIKRECSKSGTVETGGILIGYYTQDKTTAIITEASPPPRDSRRDHSSLFRGVVGLKALLENRWRNPHRTYYLGEWHYHPASSVQISRDDIEQMTSISGTIHYQCKVPILLVIGNKAKDYHPVGVFVFPLGCSYMKMQMEAEELNTTEAS